MVQVFKRSGSELVVGDVILWASIFKLRRSPKVPSSNGASIVFDLELPGLLFPKVGCCACHDGIQEEFGQNLIVILNL